MKLILASKSPRRREILSAMGYTFDIVVSEADETLSEGVSLADGVRILAERKGEAVSSLVPRGAVILSSDTLVDLDGEALGKAYHALASLSKGSRLVGIISHVSELKERIDRQIVVTKNRAGGSKAEIVV